jgi:hypothetical protein
MDFAFTFAVHIHHLIQIKPPSMFSAIVTNKAKRYLVDGTKQFCNAYIHDSTT